MYGQLERYTEVDAEKLRIFRNLRLEMSRSLKRRKVDELRCFKMEYEKTYSKMSDEDILCDASIEEEPLKVCPKCGRKFPQSETYCPNCVVMLKGESERFDIKKLETDPKIICKGYYTYTSFRDLLSDENFAIVNNFDFTMRDLDHVLKSIRLQGFKNLDRIIRQNNINLDDLEILDKVMLFAKSFVSVEYKSYGNHLGYFEYNRIHIDDRQRKSLQITTLIHELTHFFVKEILVHVLCSLMNTTKNSHVESLVTYILSNSVLNNLIDEYAAHTVEGRFTVFGYQDYSSFVAFQSELDGNDSDIAKTIGNTFAIHVKDILESFIDWDMREEIKKQFLEDTIERPDYSQLKYESCNRLSDEGFLKAIWLILTEGLQSADEEILKEYLKQFKK